MLNAVDDVRSGYIRDFISGVEVRATAEEVDAVQVFARRLVEDYGYLKEEIQTRPQYKVRQRPSGGKWFPVDIAVFRSSEHIDDNLLMIVECKQPGRKEGLAQLKLYMDMSPAEIGVWFNGSDHVYLRKQYHLGGRITYEVLPNIPQRQQRVDDIGLHVRSELRKPSNLKAVFRDLRNHLAFHAVGVTRDEALAQQIINLLFCKIYDEINTGQDQAVEFRAGANEPSADVRTRIIGLFEKVKREYDDVFEATDKVTLDKDSVQYVVGELQPYCITEAERDAVGDAFEVFIGPALRGTEGQFFTPRNVVKMVVEMLDLEPSECLLDPACGSGGFLITALDYVWRKIDEEGKQKSWSDVVVDRRKRDVAAKNFRGIDKDSFLAKVTKAYLAIMGDGRGGIFCENTLVPMTEWRHSAQAAVPRGSFDVVLTNPPFGKKIKVSGESVLAQFSLGHRWAKQKDGSLGQTEKLHKQQPPQLLFLERCLQMLREGGRLGIVVPESILGNPSYAHVVQYLLSSTVIHAVVTLPEPLFKTSGKGGTHTKVCVLLVEKRRTADLYDIFMADVHWCGHDSRGNPTYRPGPDGVPVLLDEVPDVAERYRNRHKIEPGRQDRLGFLVRSDRLRNGILVPKYYDPAIDARLAELAETHEFVPVDSLIRKKTVSMTTGVEVGKMAYGTGDIPFVRSSDISNWEIKLDFKHGVSEAIYEENAGKADAAPGDILVVRDGTYLIGTSAIVTEHDVPMLFQSHIIRLRVQRHGDIDPWLLFACLNSPIVKQQIRAKQFTQDIIDTIGRRFREVVLPIPKDQGRRQALAAETREIIESRAALRERVRLVSLAVEGTGEGDGAIGASSMGSRIAHMFAEWDDDPFDDEDAEMFDEAMETIRRNPITLRDVES